MESNLTFIVAAYAVTWGAILGYLLYVTRRSARARAAFERVPGVTEVKVS